ncbi:uncharacterized protein LOC101214824 [Cucumis sativus]|uniref:Transmembrane protein n=1 Tax=Cucumis sativus TaxID=3659 RepID=A0A0A0LB07_CUCSA|nr:uncharacterized protein LOC101214824 [Cucumis sativus]XP_011651534.1 uncharacterized protein LOC101214824 [Cucumis sativus]KGN58129.1 hypothetical protein Csa_017599 [Cucumis sativus]
MGAIDCMATKDREFEIDLEGGGNTSEDDLSSETDSTSKPHARKTFGRLRSGFLSSDRSVSRTGIFASSSNSTKLVKLGVDENVELLMESSDGEKRREFGAFAEKNNVKGKIKKNGKVHKPPRPPRGPSLDAADRIFVREIAELAVKKRATVERIKALKKMKAEKTSSFNSSLPALFITLLFFVVIIFQGMSAKGSTMVTVSDSPAPSVGGSAGLIVQHSLQFQSSPNVNEPESHILNFAGKQTSDPATAVREASLVEELKNH